MIEEYKQIREALDKIPMHDATDTQEWELRQQIWRALSRLEAREAEAPKDARELGNKLWGLCPTYSATAFITYAAAEIERYVQARIAAAPKTMPMAMLRELIERIDHGAGQTDKQGHEIIVRYGYAVEEES